MHQRARTDPSGGRGATRVPTGTQGNADLALQLPFPQVSESMGNHDSKIVDAGSVN